ncbi:MAG: FtsL-like putative cell division protein [Bacteroidota bacterium]|nr:FtsL-like putative cell division protein [Bacteroidota bacterium]
MEDRVEFIDQVEEVKESKKGILKEVFDGSILTRDAVARQLPYLVFLAFLALVYIGNRYHAEKIVREESGLQNEIKELRAKSISIAAELMDVSRQSEVSRLIAEKGMDLKEAVRPPKKLIIEE